MSERIMANAVYCYTLADLEQARRQGAEDERGRCIEAVIDATHGGALRSAVDAIRALGPIGETREDTERRVRRETLAEVRKYCWNSALDAIAEGKI